MVFPAAAVIILLILGLLLRSVVAPWYLMASVGLGFGATLGASVLVFQHLRGGPGLVFLLPVYMYLFGLGGSAGHARHEEPPLVTGTRERGQ